MTKSRTTRPVALSIAGSDNSAGAGAQADLKTFFRHGVHGLTAITCVVAEIPGRVSAIQPVKPDLVAEQIALCLEAYPVAAIKTGMLYSTAIIEAVAETLQGCPAPLVIDPVMVATSGDPLLKKSAITAYRRLLFPLASLVTPNLDELQILANQKISSLSQMKDAGRRLVDQYDCAFLLKGGHLRGRTAVDFLATPDGLKEFTAPFIKNVETHGTGCTYSAAITAGLAHGHPLGEAVAASKDYITRAIKNSLRWGSTQALDHSA